MSLLSRRTFLRSSAAGSVGLYALSATGARLLLASELPGGTLLPGAVPKFATPLVVPPAMPPVSVEGAVDVYRIGLREIRQQVLPPGLPDTRLWAYGAETDPATFHAPSFTIEATTRRPVQVTWINQLVDARGRYRPHLLPVDQTLHWANPPGGTGGRDMAGRDALPYTGPVPMVVHLHGGHTADESDGYTEAWYLPDATNIPGGYAREGSWYDTFRQKFLAKTGIAWTPGSATFRYDNDQAASTLWYHDHALGMTRLNVYAGPAGFYLVRDPNDSVSSSLPGPAPRLGDTPGTSYYEIPLAIQDRSFNADGSLFYPDTRAFFEGLRHQHLQIPFKPERACEGESDVPPIWNPEFFGNMIMVNGHTWPFLTVEQRRYRFRILNGCNSRFLILQLDRPGLAFWQVGSEGGYLQAPVKAERLLLAPAERADVVVDFTDVPTGTQVLMRNVGPDEPFSGEEPGEPFEPADPESTGLVMQFRVVPAQSADSSTPPAELVLPPREPLPSDGPTREVSLNEVDSQTVLVATAGRSGVIRQACGSERAVPFGPVAALLGTVDEQKAGLPLTWMDSATERPTVGTVETWSIHNFTMDAHPIHLHLVMFEVIERVGADGQSRPPEPAESGLKDTVVAYPGEITRIRAHFDREGLYVWHCHIVEHEDNEMMRPLLVETAATTPSL